MSGQYVVILVPRVIRDLAEQSEMAKKRVGTGTCMVRRVIGPCDLVHAVKVALK